MNLVRAVSRGSRVGIAAPAGKLGIKRFNNGMRMLTMMGYRITVTPVAAAFNGYLAGTDAHRAESLNRLFADPGLDAILCARGGYGCMRLLPLLDWEALDRHPKAIIGFSDISALLMAVYQQCRLAVFHGPVVTGLGKESYRSILSMQAALYERRYRCIRLENPQILAPGCAKGPLIGGNLTTLCHLLATPWMPDFSGHILFLEDIDESVYRIDRMLTQMKLAGCFESIAGLVLGRFTRCGPVHDIFRLFYQEFKHLAVPIVTGLPVGHEGVNLTLPIGVAAQLDAGKGCLTIASAVKLSGAAT